MNNKSEGLIQAAVTGCLTQCRQSRTPVDTLAEILCELKGQGWEEGDLQKVATKVCDEIKQQAPSTP